MKVMNVEGEAAKGRSVCALYFRWYRPIHPLWAHVCGCVLNECGVENPGALVDEDMTKLATSLR